jgi:TonB family protein
MSKTRWISALAASVVFLAGACWLVTGAFPLAAAPQMVSDAAAGSGTGGGFSVVIPPGMRAVALRVNEVAGVAGLVVPGMRVDVLISSNPPSGDSRQGTATKTLLQNIEVLSAGRDFLKDPQGKPVEAQVITVLVTPAEAEMFNLVPATVQLFLHDPSNKALVTAASTADGQVIRYSGPPRVAALISHVAPVYPPLAKQANIQGTVDLSAIVGKDGHVRDLKLVRGHPLLVQAALDAVNQWVYKPTLMNGEPVEIATDIQVNFALDSMGSQTSTPELLNRVEPHYPPLAKQANVQGTVALSATIGKDGKVQDVELVSGHPLLVQAAIDAVKQWVYEPTMINGEATEVNTEISLSFTLPPSGSGEIPPQIHAGSILSQGDRLIVYVKPVYPPEAKQTGILGTVEFSALIGKDGHVRDLKVVSGHPLLIRPALDAVKQWIYKPIMLNGEPVEVRTTILVPFTLQ